jgi:hypothetical protein
VSLYAHFTDAELIAKRTRLHEALEERSVRPSMVQSKDRTVAFQRDTSDDILRQLRAVQAELDRRAGVQTGGPFILVGPC